MPHLVVERVEKRFAAGGDRPEAVKDVSFTVERGDFVSIVGHSGSGKTTLLSILGGMARPSSGRVLVDGADLYALDGDRLTAFRRDHVGFVFQFASLLPVLTARENVLLPVTLRPRAGPLNGAETRAVELLRLVGLGDRAGAYPSQLSGGQQRRVAIARAFMNAPSLVLADEPTGDLDEQTEAEVMELFMRMNRERGTTFVMVTHNSELAGRAGRRMRMQDGGIQEL
ncbi:MAG TPA: ABC transporter ATP-binding protein [Anaeromyxobacteraceae bacterium]|nr:ABC transporter ATP-binding protein [Anaeromyxobacteraceae bacterium]